MKTHPGVIAAVVGIAIVAAVLLTTNIRCASFFNGTFGTCSVTSKQ